MNPFNKFSPFWARVTAMLACIRHMPIDAGILFALTLTFFLSACGGSSPSARATPTVFATPAPETVSAEGTVLPSQRASLAFKTAGRVAETPVKEGDAVKSGATLARLDDATLRAQVAQADAALRVAQINFERAQSANTANIAVAQANLNKLLAGPTQTEIAVAEARVQEARTGLARAQQSYDVLRWIGGATEADVRFKRDSAQAGLDIAVADMQRIKTGARAEDIAIAQAQLDLAQGNAGKAEISAADAQVKQAQAGLDVAKATLQDAALIAPFDGTVALVSVEVNQSVSPGVAAVLIGNFSKLEVETTDLAEVDVVKVLIGQTAKITADAFPDKIFLGQVVRIATSSSDRRGDKVYKVVIALGDDATNVLRWGMTTKVDIIVGK